MRKTYKYIAFVGVLLLSSCYSTSRLNNQNMAHIYQQEKITIRPDFKVYHQSDSITNLFYQIESEELLYMRKDGSDKYSATAVVQVKAYNSFEDLTVVDSVTIEINHIKQNNQSEILGGSIDLSLAEGAEYVFEILVADVNRNIAFTFTKEVDKRTSETRQNFALLDEEGYLKFPINRCRATEPIVIKHREGLGQKLYVRYYKRDFPIAMPPYSVVNDVAFDFTADSLFEYEAGKLLTLNKTGFYHFQLDSSSYQGFSLFAFADAYPELATYEDLVLPLRFLTTNREYDNLLESNNPKKSVDEFWLRIGNTEERAAIMLNTFYRRIENANRYFTSYVPGWKSDRGMIYAVFGPPNIIYKSTGGERWIYGQENSSLSYTFQFSKVENPFTDNDFSLSRSTIYRYTWAQAVDTWRQGRIYNVNVIRRDQELDNRRSNDNWYWQ